MMLSLGYIIDEYLYCKLISALATGFLGLLYLKTVVREPKVFESVDYRFLVISAITVFIFVLASTFTANAVMIFFTTGDAIESSSSDMLALSIFTSVVTAPFVEEIIFRGFMYKQLTVFGKTKAILISALIFALWHGSVIHLYTATIGGIVFACIYDKTKRLRYSVLAHMMFNGFTLIVNAIINAFGGMNIVMMSISSIIMNILLVLAIKEIFSSQGVLPIQGNISQTHKSRH